MNNAIIALRMERQCLTKPAQTEEYIRLYRDTEPGQNVYWHGFGEPPVLSFRADFDDMEFNRIRQNSRELVKGRFQGGNLGWIEAEDMELFACLCRKPLDAPNTAQTELLALLECNGAMTIQQMKEKTGKLVKEITPILHRLQEAFLVYEDQHDGEWDRLWYSFKEMFPNVDLEKYTRTEALKIVLRRFAYRMVWFDAAMAKSFYKLPAKEITKAVKELSEEGILAEYEGGFVLAEDVELLESSTATPPHMTFVMHRNDILVKSYEHVIKERYSGDYELLQLLLLDGELHGAVQGKFKYGPYIIENVVVDEEYEDRREEILRAVRDANAGSVVQRYNFEELLPDDCF